jgi:DNA-binding PadR family transcriptional regulator
MSDVGIGEFERLVLLAVMQLEGDARAAAVRRRIEQAAERKVSRGALYATLDRLESKGLVAWEVEETGPARGGQPRRRFRVTPAGVDGLRRAHRSVSRLSEGLESLLERP